MIKLVHKNSIPNLDNACEIYEGIIHHNKDVCCYKNCSKCGGQDCWKRRGGSDNCCGTSIRNNTNVCGFLNRMAPCRLEKPGRAQFI